MRFSILIPVYNVEKYLPECLQSIKNQTFKDFEVILIDDGSTDNSGYLCNQFQKDFQNVIVKHKSNQGLISARRTGISLANGEYCVFCDSDDFLETNALMELNNIIETNVPDIIIYNAYLYTNNKKKILFEHIFEPGLLKEKEILYDMLLLTYKVNSLCIKACKKDTIDIENDYSCFYSCNYGEDLLQTIPVVLKATTIFYLNQPLYNYRVTSGMMRKYNPAYYCNYKAVNRQICIELKNENINDFTEKIAFHLLTAAYGATTQLKYADIFEYNSLNLIATDNYFRRAYQDLKCSKYTSLFNSKQKLILWLLYKKKYTIIRIMLMVRGHRN